MLATLVNASAVYVVADPCDLRKSIDGLALAVETSLGHSPLSGSVFVFFNRGRDKVKLLWWDRHGFWLAYKRLEKGPGTAADSVVRRPFGKTANPARQRPDGVVGRSAG